LKDGRKIGGKYHKNSFTSSYPVEEQIYLEEVWELDENEDFKRVIDRTEGMIISRDEILSVELFI